MVESSFEWIWLSVILLLKSLSWRSLAMRAKKQHASAGFQKNDGEKKNGRRTRRSCLWDPFSCMCLMMRMGNAKDFHFSTCVRKWSVMGLVSCPAGMLLQLWPPEDTIKSSSWLLTHGLKNEGYSMSWNASKSTNLDRLSHLLHAWPVLIPCWAGVSLSAMLSAKTFYINKLIKRHMIAISWQWLLIAGPQRGSDFNRENCHYWGVVIQLLWWSYEVMMKDGAAELQFAAVIMNNGPIHLKIRLEKFKEELRSTCCQIWMH